MKWRWMGRLGAALVAIGLTLSVASADSPSIHAKAKLSGFNESPPKLSGGTGTFSATAQGGSLTYTLTYSGLSTSAVMAHIHFGQPGVNGGIFLWLCGSVVAPGPAGTPTCPAAGGTVTRTVTAADIVGPVPDQGLSNGDFAGALRILESGNAYVNVHTTRFGAGEIRGPVRTDDESSD
jgi:hypothetical protein